MAREEWAGVVTCHLLIFTLNGTCLFLATSHWPELVMWPCPSWELGGSEGRGLQVECQGSATEDSVGDEFIEAQA